MRRISVGCAVVFVISMFVAERDASALWKHTWRPAWPGGNIPVCYTSTLAAQPNFAGWLYVTQNVIENTWERYANLHFTGWGPCTTSAPAGTLVLDYSKCAFNGQLGYNAGAPTYLWVDFNNTDPLIPGTTNHVCNSGDNSTPGRWAYLAVHEFGHNLSFEHEQDRSDNLDSSGKPICSYGIGPTGGYEDHLGTQYDNGSVMSYCGPTYGYSSPTMGWMIDLTPWDIVGITNLYGRKPAGSIVGDHGNCVGVTSTDLSAPLVTTRCNGSMYDTWTRSNVPGRNTFSTWFPGGPYGAMCMDVPNAVLNPFGTFLWNYACNNSIAQQFKLDHVKWKALGAMCVVTASTAAGTGLQIQKCGTPGFYEDWDFESDGTGTGQRIKLAGTSMCTNVPWGSATVGNPLVLYPCQSPPTANETFTMAAGEQITYGGLCFNVWGGNPTPGSPLALYTCGSSYSNERFHVSGPIHGEGGQCLDIESGQIELWPCGSYATQSWDYYFPGWSDY